MRLNDVDFPGPPPIDGYGRGGFRVGGTAHMGALIVLPTRVLTWAPNSPLDPDSFADALAAAGEIDLLLVGTGAEIAPLPAAARAALEGAGLTPEPMATPSACRTYNVLVAEERRVGAALIPV